MKPVSLYVFGYEYGFAGSTHADRKNAIYEAHANISAKQLGAFKAILTPERVNKYRAELAELNNSKGRNYLMMEAAKHVNGGIFEGLHVSSGDLKRLVLTD